MPDTKYLIQRRGIYLFNWRVPSDCKHAFKGKTMYTKSLKTQSLREAQLRRTVALGECMKIVSEIRSDTGSAKRDLFKANLQIMKDATSDTLEGAWYALENKRKPTTDEGIAYREALAATYLGCDSKLAKVTLRDALKCYESEKRGDIADKTISHATRAVSVFLDYLQMEDCPIEDITKKTVKDFIKASLSAGKTTSNRLSLLSTIFNTAVNDGVINEDKRNPFERQRVKTSDSQSFERFSYEQLNNLLSNSVRFKESEKTYHKYLLPRLAYATGCRIEELCSLQREQIKTKGGITYIAIAEGVDSYKGKTLNSGRRIPIHNLLETELLTWRDSDDHHLLFPILASKRADGKYGDKYSKQFARFKQTCGVTKRSQGFHSFRVHMATNLERAGVPESRAVWIMGHTRTVSLSYGLYSDGPSLEQLKSDIENCVVWPKHELQI